MAYSIRTDPEETPQMPVRPITATADNPNFPNPGWGSEDAKNKLMGNRTETRPQPVYADWQAMQMPIDLREHCAHEPSCSQ